jgi:hypothetical protein
MSPYPHLKKESDPIAEMFSSYLEFRTSDKTHKLSDSEKQLPYERDLTNYYSVHLLLLNLWWILEKNLLSGKDLSVK